MAKKKITFDITPEGITIDTENYKGISCLKELDKIRAYLKDSGGIDMMITDQKKKPSLYQPAEKIESGSRVI